MENYISYYGCVSEGNDCSKKDQCSRYIQDNDTKITLYKYACTDSNNHILFIQEVNKNAGNETAN